MSGLWRDIRFGWRALLSKPAFTATALVSLVLGIGSNTAIFTLLDAVFLRPLPVEDPRDLVAVYQTLRSPAGEYTGFRSFSYPNAVDLRERSRALTDLAVYQWSPVNLSGGLEPERAVGMFVSAAYFPVLGVRPYRGRLFTESEDSRAAAPVAVLSHACWSRLFGSDPGILGRVLRVNGRGFTVVGVAPPGFHGTEISAAVDVWLPIPHFADLSQWGAYFDDRTVSLFRVIGRLRPDTSVDQADAELDALARQLELDHPAENEGVGARVRPLLEGTVVPTQRQRYLDYSRTLVTAVGLILLVACLNVANLLLARGFERGREIAVRQAMGADRGRLVRQLLTENLLLFFLGGLLSLPVARWSLALLWAFRPPTFDANAISIQLDARVWGFALAVALVVGLLFGVVPALRAATPDLVRRLKESDTLPVSGAGRQWLRPRTLLVIVQVGLAFVALAGAGLYLRNLRTAYRMDLGFATDHVVLLTVAPGDQGYDEPRIRDFYRRLLERIEHLPGIEAAGLSENRLLRGAIVSRQIFLPGADEPVVIGQRDYHRTNVVSPGFFDAVGIRLEQGRDFTGAELDDGPPVAIVNHTMAETLWPDEPAIGQRFLFDFPDRPPIEVVGVVSDAKYRQLDEEAQFFVYLPLGQNLARAMTVHVRTALDAPAVLPSLRREVQALDPDMPLADTETISFFIDNALWLERASTTLLGVFGGLALLLASVGVYGVLAHSVQRRRKELAIRFALGARRIDVLREILLEAAVVVGSGLGLGLVLSLFVLGAVMESQLYGISAADPLTYLTLIAVLVAVAFVGCLVPARQAANTDPVRTLRAE